MRETHAHPASVAPIFRQRPRKQISSCDQVSIIEDVELAEKLDAIRGHQSIEHVGSPNVKSCPDVLADATEEDRVNVRSTGNMRRQQLVSWICSQCRELRPCTIDRGAIRTCLQAEFTATK